MNTNMISFDAKKREQLRKAYNAARDAGQEQFKFEGRDVLVAYAKYMLEYLDMQKLN